MSRRETRRLRVLELYCGIGGCAAALACSDRRLAAGRPDGPRSLQPPAVGPAARVIAAVDINRTALEVYRRNFRHPVAARTIESLAAADLERWRADLWWLSPPCQPFTRRGLRRDDADPRARSLLQLIELLERAPPAHLALENVPGFRGSRTHARLLAVLDRHGYHHRDRLLCPTELGIPNRRRRFYLVASRQPLPADRAPRARPRPLADYLDRHPEPGLSVPAELVHRYRRAVDVVDPADPDAVASCFTSAYGRSPVRSGSYLRMPSGPRRFSPAEILRLLGFPAGFTLPSELPLGAAWRLVGNSLSVPAVRAALASIPGLAPGLEAAA